MGAVNFYLKKAEPKTGKSLIYLQFKYNGHYVLVYTFGQSIHKKDWNDKKQRVKSNNLTTSDGQYSLNDLLDRLENVCEKAYRTELSRGIPEPATLKKYFSEFFNQHKKKPDKPSLYRLIDWFINNEIPYRGTGKAKTTLAKYKTALANLKEFEAKARYQILLYFLYQVPSEMI
jgi:hypothetical protein